MYQKVLTLNPTDKAEVLIFSKGVTSVEDSLFWPLLITRGIKQGIFQGKGIFGHLPCILCDTSYDCLQYHSRNNYYQLIP